MVKIGLSLAIGLLAGIPIGNALENWFLSSGHASGTVASALMVSSFYVASIGTIFALMRIALR